MTPRVAKLRKESFEAQPEISVEIKEEELQAVLEAGLYAPHAGDQAWHFTVIQDKGLLEKLNLAAKEAARQLDMEDRAIFVCKVLEEFVEVSSSLSSHSLVSHDGLPFFSRLSFLSSRTSLPETAESVSFSSVRSWQPA